MGSAAANTALVEVRKLREAVNYLEERVSVLEKELRKRKEKL